ncbi:MAG: hypothetical protein EGP82_05440 [Odoribacter splanchnicus]|nr:hypothetical protein [Odoribacter splanchnicus]
MMRLKVILIAWCAIVWCVGCNDDDVDTSYSLRADELVVTLENPAAENENVTGKFNEFLIENEYLTDFQFSGESRKENNDKAVARFEEKYKSLQMIDLGKIFSLEEGQKINVSFLYSLYRGEEQIGDSKQVSLSFSEPET